MYLTILASGSKGNTAVLQTNDTTILIDLGLRKRPLFERAAKKNIDVSQIDAVFITHEHSDHVMGLTAMKTIQAPLYMSKGTLEGLKDPIRQSIKDIDIHVVKHMDKMTINDIKVTLFNVSHDANEPLGLILEHHNKKVVFITDTGYVHTDVFPLIQNADCYVIEANHDPEALMLSERPFSLKRRILGDKGHLSNQDSAVLLAYVIGLNTKRVICAHISDECNAEESIISTFSDVFLGFAIDHTHISLHCASQDEPSEVFEI